MEIKLGQQTTDFFPIFKDIMIILLAAASVLLSIVFAKNNKIIRNVDFISDINKIMIEKPELWAIYDSEAQEAGDISPELVNKIHVLFNSQ